MYLCSESFQALEGTVSRLAPNTVSPWRDLKEEVR